MPLMMSQILKSVDFTKIQKSIYLKNKTFFLQIKKFIESYFMAKNSFVAEVTFHRKKACYSKEKWFVAEICLILKLMENNNDHTPDALIIPTF